MAKNRLLDRCCSNLFVGFPSEFSCLLTATDKLALWPAGIMFFSTLRGVESEFVKAVRLIGTIQAFVCLVFSKLFVLGKVGLSQSSLSDLTGSSKCGKEVSLKFSRCFASWLFRSIPELSKCFGMGTGFVEVTRFD